MLTKERYLLVLVYLDKNKIDIAGNKYPQKGFVRAKEFRKNIDLRYGLSGISWGKIDVFSPIENIEENCWAIIKTIDDDNIVLVDFFTNMIKFESGFVLYMGNIKIAANFIIKNKNNPNHFLAPEIFKIKNEEIAGSKEWFKIFHKNKKKMIFT